MTSVAEYNLEDGKVRDSKFLSFTPVCINKENGWYGRANTLNSTCLYLAENSDVAVVECKPKVGDRIILTDWTTVERNPLIMYPINSVEKINAGVDKATNALVKKLNESNRYFSRIIRIIQEFIGNEFVKDIPVVSENKYEYFFSAYFADKVMTKKLTFLDNKNNPVLGQYDGIVYPSIAAKYNFDNFAIRESSVSKLKANSCSEYLVEETDYENFKNLKSRIPFKGKLLRKSVAITDKITWDDD